MRVSLLLLLILSSFNAAAEGLDVRVDVETAKAILALPGTTPSDDELTRIASLPGVEALIRQAARFDKSATKEALIASLRTFAAGKAPEPDPFKFARVLERLAPTRLLLERIVSKPSAFTDRVAARIASFAPGIDFQTTLTLIVGGTSDGFAPGAGNLYVALDYLRDDWDGLVLLAAHELYHAVQAELLTRSGVQAQLNAMTGRKKEAMTFLMNTLKEGTGSLVGDPLTVAKPGVYNEWFVTKYKRNLDRIRDNMALFETILFRLANDDVPASRLYNLGFSGSWDSPLYFAGYRMAQVIEKYDGRDAIRKAWSKPPAHFFQRYLALAAEHPDDPLVVPLSDSTKRILVELASPTR